MTGANPSRVNVERDVEPRKMWHGLSVLIVSDLWSIVAAFILFTGAYSLLFEVTTEFMSVIVSAVAVTFAADLAVILRSTILYGYPFR